MQRNIFSQKNLKTLFIILAVIFYTSLVSIFPLFPPFFGVIYILFFDSIDNKRYIDATLSLFFTLFLESIFNLPLFFTIVNYFFIYFFIETKFKYYFGLYRYFDLLRVLIVDIVLFLAILAYEWITEIDIIKKSAILVYYLIADIVGVFLF